MTLVEEFYDYLICNDFVELMNAWKHQYERLGRLGGTVSFKINDWNREAMEGFFATDLTGRKNYSLNWMKMKHHIDQSKFEGVDFVEVMKLYYGELLTNEEKRIEIENKVKGMLDEIHANYVNTKAILWLDQALEKQQDTYRYIYQMCVNEEHEKLDSVMRSINELPIFHNQTQNLAVFSSHITGDPHAFDIGTKLNYLLIDSIKYYLSIEEDTTSIIDKNRVLYQAGIIRDDINNTCAIFRINAVKKNNTIHLGWNTFYESYECWNINTSNLTNIKSIDDTQISHILIIENPSIFHLLIDEIQHSNINNIGVLCSSGQPNACVYELLDLIQQSNIKMVYSGDIDPEGIDIADRLKSRYQDLILWRYSIVDYHNSISNKEMSNKRRKMLNKIKNPQLQQVAEEMKRFGYNAYQENIIKDYIRDLCYYKK